jgi:hypothetical protein
MEAFPYISKRFALERFLGLSEEEIKKNEQLWLEENAEDVTQEPKGSDLRNIGVSTGDFQADSNTADDLENAEMEQEPGSPETAGPVAGPEGAAAAGAGAGPVGGGGAAGAMQI